MDVFLFMFWRMREWLYWFLPLRLYGGMLVLHGKLFRLLLWNLHEYLP